MRKWVLVCTFLAVLFSRPAEAAQSPEATQAIQPTISFTSDPSGAEVELNGTVVGKTPLMVAASVTGVGYTIVIKKVGYAIWTTQTVSVPGHSAFNAALVPIKPEVKAAPPTPSYPQTPPTVPSEAASVSSANHTSIQHSPSMRPSTMRWAKGAPNCDYLLENGQFVQIVRVDGIELRAALRDTGWKMRAQVGVVNATKSRLDVIPDLFSLTVVEPKRKTLRLQGPEELAKSIDRRATWHAIGASLGGMATKETTSESQTNGTVSVFGSGGFATGVYRETTTTTQTEPDYEARRRAAEQVSVIQTRRDEAIAGVHSQALRGNTLMPGQRIEGFVFFEREKKADSLVLTVPVGNVTVEFPFGKRKK
jgi:hypothetical protein